MRKLRSILPVHIHFRPVWKGDRDSFFVNAFELVGVKIEPNTIGQIEPVVNGIAAEKGSGTDSKVVQSVFDDRVVNHGRCGVR